MFLFCRNYVVQFILELRIPSATSTLTSQFEGNYVHLSTQKFSSHVVEKCLDVLNYESRSRIIHELLSVSHFEQLLQDPHANYVVQTALRISEVWESTPCNNFFFLISSGRYCYGSAPPLQQTLNYPTKMMTLKIYERDEQVIMELIWFRHFFLKGKKRSQLDH